MPARTTVILADRPEQLDPSPADGDGPRPLALGLAGHQVGPRGVVHGVELDLGAWADDRPIVRRLATRALSGHPLARRVLPPRVLADLRRSVLSLDPDEVEADGLADGTRLLRRLRLHSPRRDA